MANDEINSLILSLRIINVRIFKDSFWLGNYGHGVRATVVEARDNKLKETGKLYENWTPFYVSWRLPHEEYLVAMMWSCPKEANRNFHGYPSRLFPRIIFHRKRWSPSWIPNFLHMEIAMMLNMAFDFCNGWQFAPVSFNLVSLVEATRSENIEGCDKYH